MKISSISIKGIGGIKNLDLKFNNKLNLICGTNGVGKTTIINCIANSFVIQPGLFNLKRHANSNEGKVSLKYITKDGFKEVNNIISDFNPNERKSRSYDGYEYVTDIFYFNSNREINYKPLDAVKVDPKSENFEQSQSLVMGIHPDDIKSWFVNRYLFAPSNGLNEQQLHNHMYSRECFSIIDKNIKFNRILSDTFDIMLSTPNGEIYFEYLSSGYKSCIFILLGIIKEIEFRYKNPYIKINEFDGVLLIDEIDLHLHPQWQSTLLKSLKNMLPNAQIIATTHSPNMLQTVLPEEIIALDKDNNENVFQKILSLEKYGLQGWTIEEILTDIMGLPSTSSEMYLDTLIGYDHAMNNEDKEKIISYYHTLDKMLHPKNPIRKLLKMQVAEWED